MSSPESGSQSNPTLLRTPRAKIRAPLSSAAPALSMRSRVMVAKKESAGLHTLHGAPTGT